MATGIPKSQWNGADVDEAETKSDNSLDIHLAYPGKQTEAEILATHPAKCVMLGKVGDAINRLYYGDNQPILANLLNDATIKQKIKLIYIDPPFATKSIFQSRNQQNAYQDLLFGSRYLEFLRHRLVLLREILADDGSIYLHLDENMAFHAKIILDEIFGQSNFRNWITRKKCNPKNYTSHTYGNISDFILFYTKSNQYIWNRPFEAWTEERAKKEYEYIEPETGRRYKKVPIHAPGVRNGETGQPWRGMMPPPGKHWQFTPKTLDEMDARGEIFWSKNGNPRRKVYLDASQGVPVQDIWLDYRDAHNQNIKVTGYPTEKNPALLARVIQASSNEGDLVLDCFSGSGTTLVVADELGRRWLGIDNSMEAISTTLKRFANGSERMGDFVSQGKQQVQQLSLFDGDESANGGNFLYPPSSIVKNFGLYADAAVAGDLQSFVGSLMEM